MNDEYFDGLDNNERIGMGLVVIRWINDSSVLRLWVNNGFKYNWLGSKISGRWGENLELSKETSLVDGIEGEIGIIGAIGGVGIIDVIIGIIGATCVGSDSRGGRRGMRWTPTMNVSKLGLWSRDGVVWIWCVEERMGRFSLKMTSRLMKTFWVWTSRRQ